MPHQPAFDWGQAFGASGIWRSQLKSLISSHANPNKPGPLFVAVAVYMLMLLVAGGASRMTVTGQVVVRLVSFIYLAGLILWWPRTLALRARPIFYLLLGAIALVSLQLVPLPSAWWHALPGRDLFAPADVTQPTWRPIAIVPSAALNAAISLIVPLVTYLLMSALPRSQDRNVVGLLLSIVFIEMLVALVQLSGVSFHDPLVNGRGTVAGTFANRNHFALFLALGCLLAPVWALRGEGRPTWRLSLMLGLLPLLLLTILASGSRAGMFVGVIGFIGGGLLVRGHIRALLKPYPRWIGPALIGSMLALIALLILLSVDLGRAASISRILAADTDSDMRTRAIPTILTMFKAYFPVGAGFGGFDILFRVHEPDALLKPTYFNRAHNDFVEVVLDGGIAGVLLLLAGLGWWLKAAVRAFRAGPDHILSRLGALMILLIILASVIDYPARTPTIMACLVVAGVWLHGSTVRRRTMPAS